MNLDTITKLNQLNHQFYQVSARDFSNTRQTAWDGWQKVRAKLKSFGQTNHKLEVLDVGCGNGRWAQFLASVWPDLEFDYTGLDLSQNLLAAASKSLANLPKINSCFIEFDLVKSWVDKKDLSDPVWQNKFDLIGLFGVLHHLPSLELRRYWLKQLITQLKPDGLCILTYWRFDREKARFDKKTIKPQTVNIQPKELETGDLILDWRQGGLNYRYCHLANDAEIQANTTWIQENLPEASLLTSYEADGKSGSLNHYQVWHKAPSDVLTQT